MSVSHVQCHGSRKSFVLVRRHVYRRISFAGGPLRRLAKPICTSPEMDRRVRPRQPKFFQPPYQRPQFSKDSQSINQTVNQPINQPTSHKMLSLFRTSGVVLGRRAFSTTPVATSFAKIALLGRLAAEPEISTTSSGMEMVRYAVGVSQGKDKPTTWYKVVNFEPDARGKEYLMSMQKGWVLFGSYLVTRSAILT